MWEYFFNKKEYLIYSHDHDPHPVALTHHDFALEKILKTDPKLGRHRNKAIDISQQALKMKIPEFSESDYVASPDTELLDNQFRIILNELRSN
jgi:hypothetical protein